MNIGFELTLNCRHVTGLVFLAKWYDLDINSIVYFLSLYLS